MGYIFVQRLLTSTNRTLYTVNMFNRVDWGSVFLPDAPFLEIIVRGSVMYLALFIMLRIVLKRQAGTLGMTDLLLNPLQKGNGGRI